MQGFEGVGTNRGQKGGKVGTYKRMRKTIHSYINPFSLAVAPLCLVLCLYRPPVDAPGNGREVPPRWPLLRAELLAASQPQKRRAVDNSVSVTDTTDAQFLGVSSQERKLLNLLENSASVQKVTHNAHYIQRALC